jgi:hypothetical protein
MIADGLQLGHQNTIDQRRLAPPAFAPELPYPEILRQLLVVCDFEFLYHVPFLLDFSRFPSQNQSK